MQCYFCKRNEDEINNTFSQVFQNLENKIQELDTRIKNKKEDFQREYGFTEKNFEKLRNINKNISSMEIKYVMEKYDVFRQVEVNLELLKSYLNKFNPKISNSDNLENLINLFIEEPTDERLNPIIKDFKARKEIIVQDIEYIKDKIKFHEVTGNNDFVSKNEKDIMISILNKKDVYYIEMNKDKKQEKMFLCPYCYHLFNTNQLAKIVNSKNLENELEQLRGKYDHIPDWDFVK